MKRFISSKTFNALKAEAERNGGIGGARFFAHGNGVYTDADLQQAIPFCVHGFAMKLDNTKSLTQSPISDELDAVGLTTGKNDEIVNEINWGAGYDRVSFKEYARTAKLYPKSFCGVVRSLVGA